ncbi:MAG: fructosamine kinase family protein [Mycobacteriales bacterium]
MNLAELTSNPAVIPQLIEHQRIRITGIRRDPEAACTAQLWTLDDGAQLFAKSREHAPVDFFASETRGLSWLAETGSVRVPGVIAVLDELLVLRWIPPGSPTRSGAAELGTQLAKMHRSGGGDAFGAPRPGFGNGFVGVLPLDNTPCSDWAEFFVTRRLEPYLRQARDSAIIDADQAGELAVLQNLVSTRCGPVEPPARIHGDLWSGNVHYDSGGRPWLIDAAAAHLGHRETDLATLQLFGAPFLTETLAAYHAQYPLEDGWRDRVALHQLHLLLVHAVIFGAAYVGRTLSAARTLR